MSYENDNKSVFRSFFQNEYQKLLEYIRYRVSNSFLTSSPEDIIQDVALSIYSKLDSGKSVNNLGSYVYRSIRNKIIDLYRSQKNITSLENYNDEEGHNLLLDTIFAEQDGVDEYQFMHRKRILFNAIEKLKPEQRAILIATEFEKRSFQELSIEWDEPVGTLLARKHRAISSLSRIATDMYKESDVYNENEF